MFKYLAALCILGSALAVQKSYDGFKVIEALPSSLEQVDFLKSLEVNNDIDFWETIHRVANKPVKMMTSADNVASIKTILDAANIPFQIVIDNVEEVFEQERQVNQARRVASRNANKGRAVPDFTYFHTYEEIYEYLDFLALNYPNLVELEVLGQTGEGRDLKALKISLSGSVDGSRPIIFVDALIHAREWISGSVVLKVIQQLVENSADNLDILTGIDWIIVPVVNPDGYSYSHTSTRMWRKNRRINTGSTCAGVDLNRNFNYQWNVPGGASTSPCSESYRGESPSSENEAILLSELIERYDSTELYLTLHSYGNYWMYPWGYAVLNIDNYVDHVEVGTRAVDALYAVSGTSYTLGNSAALLYIASGASDDYAAGPGQVTHVFTVELPGGGSQGFDIPPARIAGVVAETWPAIQESARFIAERASNSK